MEDMIEQLKEILDVCNEQDDAASVRVAIVGYALLHIIEKLMEEVGVEAD